MSNRLLALLVSFAACFWAIVAGAQPEPEPNPVLVIGLAGPSCAGKTELARAIEKYTQSGEVAVLSMDSYFKDLDQLPQDRYIDGQPNGDDPSALNSDLLIQHIEELKQEKAVQIPRYDFLSDKSMGDGPALGPVKVLIVEGMHALWNPRLRKLLDYSFFVNADADLRLGRRLKRDAAERGKKDVMEILDYYMRVVRPMQSQFVETTRGFADRQVDGEDSAAAALEISAEIVRYLGRVRKKEPAFFYDRQIVPHVQTDLVLRGETIQQMLLQQGPAAQLIVGGRLRPPTRDHMGLMIQTMHRFGFRQGKFLPANHYKTGDISNAQALLLSRVAVKHFNQALDLNNIQYEKFAYTPQTGGCWEDVDGKQYRVQVDSTEISIKNPVIEGEDRRTLIAFDILRRKAGGDPKSVFWVAGGDSFATLPTWNSKWKDHLGLANWIVVSRPEFDGMENNVSFESHDPIRAVMPDEVVNAYNYYFDHTTQTHVYENKDPSRPNMYVIRLPSNGTISATSVRKSLTQSTDNRLIARAGTTPAVFEACMSTGFFKEAPSATHDQAVKECEARLLSPKGLK